MPAHKPSITLLFPFDIGRSYFFEARTSEGKDDFERMLGNGLWKADQYLAREFRVPLGLPASLDVTQENNSELQKFTEKIPEKLFDKESLEIEVIVFTIGSANLLVHLDLQECFFEHEKSFKKWTDDALRDLAPVANEARKQYFKLMEQSNERVAWFRPYSERVLWLRSVDTGRKSDPSQELKKLDYSYPLIFLNKNHTFSSSRSASSVEYKQAHLQISWSEAYIRGCWNEEKREIERHFVAADASWHTLYIMDKVVSSSMLDALRSEARQQVSIRTRLDYRVIRLAYIEAANASQPSSWTLSGQHLGLLKAIHDVWGSKELWKTIGGRTALLAAHYDQLEAEENGSRNQKVAIAALAFAFFSVVSASADLVGALDFSGDIVAGNWVRLISILAMPVILGIFAVLWWRS